MDDYSRASWVLPLRAKSDTPAVFEIWAVMMGNGMDGMIKDVVFNNAQELVAGRMWEERGSVGPLLTAVERSR
jgi:hypothetical protein